MHKYITRIKKLIYGEIAIIFIIILMIFITIFYNCQNNIKYVNYQKNYDNIINEIISKNNYNSTNTSYTIIDQKYINIIDKTNLMPLNTLIKITNQNININDLLLKDKIEDFNNLLAKETLKKYPEFISTVILNENNRSYEITEDKITVYFSNENIIPTFNERISIDLTCSDIKNIINYNCNEVKYLEDLNQASSVPHLNKIVAITFDDGPNLKYTNEVVDILEKNKANGTFFVIGNKLTYQYKSILLNCLAKNNEIGSHTYSHKVLTKLSLDKLKNEQEFTNNNYFELTKNKITLTRPPYGKINNLVKNNINTPIIMWNVDPLDWKYKDAQKIFDNVINNVKDGSIILLHDAYKTSVEALRLILPKLYTMGYQVTTVSNLAAKKGVTLENNKVYYSFN